MLAFAGLLLLLFFSWGNWGQFTACLIYGLSALSLFSASSLYHASKRSENSGSIFRKLDHAAIYIMIAGTYTPLAYHYLEGAWLWSILGIQWGLVLAGLFFKLLFIRSPRFLSVLIYLIMGWMAVVFFRELWPVITLGEFLLLLGGGIAYSLGAVIYGLKKPDPLPPVFGFHEIFHLLILAGAGLHFSLVLGTVV
ncbi:MAG: hemolysin III family protein [Dehalococcoidaceae bacterium]|nr:hemolysin III family protein [Dehalococcoidaceae bacterium]